VMTFIQKPKFIFFGKFFVKINSNIYNQISKNICHNAKVCYEKNHVLNVYKIIFDFL
jgi:hypothetical protein